MHTAGNRSKGKPTPPRPLPQPRPFQDLGCVGAVGTKQGGRSWKEEQLGLPLSPLHQGGTTMRAAQRETSHTATWFLVA